MVPKMRANGYFLLGFELGQLFIDVKDASSGKLFYPSDLESVL